MTRACYGTVASCGGATKGAATKVSSKAPVSPVYHVISASPVYHAVSPVYHAVTPSYRPTPPTYSERVEAAASPAATAAAVSPAAAEEHKSQDPYGGDTPTYHPFSKDYVPQNPCGSPVYHVNPPNGYCPISGEPIYGARKRAYPGPTSPKYSATSPTYSPHSPWSLHTAAAAKRACLRWGK